MSVIPLRPPAFQDLTASRSAGTQAPERSLAVISSRLGISSSVFFRRGIILAAEIQGHRRAHFHKPHLISIVKILVVSLPKMSMTFTTTSYLPGSTYSCFTASSNFGSFRVR